MTGELTQSGWPKKLALEPVRQFKLAAGNRLTCAQSQTRNERKTRGPIRPLNSFSNLEFARLFISLKFEKDRLISRRCISDFKVMYINVVW